MEKQFKILIAAIIALILFLPVGAAAAAEASQAGAQAESIQDVQTADNPWEVLQQALDLTMENYYSDADREKLLQGALKGMMEAVGDPYSQYFSPQDLAQFETSTEGSFTGVGMQVEQSGDYVKVVAPLKGSPAERAGVKTGDIITAVNGEDIKGFALEKVVDLIRGETGTAVNLTIMRTGAQQPLELEMKRELIEMEIMQHRMLDKYLGYISLNTFSNRAPEEFEQSLRDLKEQGALGLVLDLRSNPGGYLTAGLGLAAEFVDKGQALVHIIDKQGNKISYTSMNSSPEKMPVVVLVNKGSASASEIVAGALQDYGIARLVGETTYGKASVQTLFPLDDGGAVKLTTNHYLTPKEREIQNVGLTPDFQVEGEEAQLKKAVEVLKEKLSTEYQVKEIAIKPGSSAVTVNEEDVTLPAAPYLEQGVTMVPVKLFADIFQASLLWDDELQTAIVSREDTGMALLKVGDKQANFGGNEVTMSRAPQLKEGSVFVPLREVAAFFNAATSWDPENGLVKSYYLIKK